MHQTRANDREPAKCDLVPLYYPSLFCSLNVRGIVCALLMIFFFFFETLQKPYGTLPILTSHNSFAYLGRIGEHTLSGLKRISVVFLKIFVFICVFIKYRLASSNKIVPGIS